MWLCVCIAAMAVFLMVFWRCGHVTSCWVFFCTSAFFFLLYLKFLNTNLLFRCALLVTWFESLSLLSNSFSPNFSFLLRLDALNRLIGQKDSNPAAPETQTNSMVPFSAQSQPPKWLPGFPRHPPASGAKAVSPALAWARPTEALQVERRALRVRRHAHSRGGHHAKLMRVGCVLGTCQVQNLSHRLYQLIGQSGREDSSPINPKSPHSFG